MTEALPLQGKFAIVTGGARGVGQKIVETLASKGASGILFTHVSSTSLPKAQSIITTLTALYPTLKIHSLQNDISTPEGPRALISYALKHFTSPQTNSLQIDILINNAGIAGPQSLAAATASHFHRLYNTNVLGPLLLTSASIPHLPHDRSGRIINITSLAGKRGTRLVSIYGGTKAALDSMTRTWSRELAERATVNSVVPGPVETDMYQVPEEFVAATRPYAQVTPLAQLTEEEKVSGEFSEVQLQWYEKLGGRPAKAQEVANAVLLLLRPESSWITGSSIYACGGAVMGL